MKKLLFLDVDGVLNHRKYYEDLYKKTGTPHVLILDPDCLLRLHRIVKETGCEIVLSSTWRNSQDARQVLLEAGVKWVGTTPNCSDIRGHEVNKWLWDNASKVNDLEKWAILDDDSDFTPDQPLFQTSFANGGLTAEIAEKVIAHLNG